MIREVNRSQYLPANGKPLEQLSDQDLMTQAEHVSTITLRRLPARADQTWVDIADILDVVKGCHIQRLRHDWHQDAPFTPDVGKDTSKSRRVHKRKDRNVNYVPCRAIDSDVECPGHQQEHFCWKRKNLILAELAAYRDDNGMEHGLHGEEAYAYCIYFARSSQWNCTHRAEGYRTLDDVLIEAALAGMNKVLNSILQEEGIPFNK